MAGNQYKDAMYKYVAEQNKKGRAGKKRAAQAGGLSAETRNKGLGYPNKKGEAAVEKAYRKDLALDIRNPYKKKVTYKSTSGEGPIKDARKASGYSATKEYMQREANKGTNAALTRAGQAQRSLRGPKKRGKK